jgi:hypothetical protein
LSYQEVSSHLARDGLENAQLAVGIDFSEPDNSLRSENHQACQQALQSIAIAIRAFAPSINGGRFNAYGFGDVSTQAHSVFSFHDSDRPCVDEGDCLNRYKDILGASVAYKNASFSPLMREVLCGVRREPRFHVLVILTQHELEDAQFADFKQSLNEAALCPLSVIVVGVSGGRWSKMKSIRKGNYNFVQFEPGDYDQSELTSLALARFTARALIKLPRQYRLAKNNGHFKRESLYRSTDVPRPMRPPDRVGKDLHQSTCSSNSTRTGCSSPTLTELTAGSYSSAESGAAGRQPSGNVAKHSAPPEVPQVAHHHNSHEHDMYLF